MTVVVKGAVGDAGSEDAPGHTGSRRLVALFAVYLVLLVWLVLWKFDLPWRGPDAERTVKLVPFVAAGGNGASRPSEVLANVLLFVPFGLYLGLLGSRIRWGRACRAVAAASAGLEVAEYVLAVGRSDVTDVVTNTLGGVAGLVVVAVVRRAVPGRAERALARVCAATTVIAIVAVAAFVAAPGQLHNGLAGAGNHGRPGQGPDSVPPLHDGSGSQGPPGGK
ncbi:VanZ family protein [Luteimicrobium subarcticum]|uniref:VanZ like protein n=1 Tax=Luteimicrobium subarcticum TaxID=620910 RepID=A0A2M8W484_9MICO|nr:VanZ family protein [Luteimicrobium subarcticum]PJI85730.1 VanZ like protein [Luteimicrobium subarcticum]